MKTKTIFFCALGLILSGCSNIGNMPDYRNESGADLSQKAIVIARAKDCDTEDTMWNSFCNGKAKIYFRPIGLSNWNILNDYIGVYCPFGKYCDYEIKVAPIGKYELKYIQRGEGTAIATWSGYNIKFTLQEGTVNYIGDIVFHSKSGKIDIIDNFEEAKLELSKFHPEIADKLVRNIAKSPIYFALNNKSYIVS